MADYASSTALPRPSRSHKLRWNEPTTVHRRICCAGNPLTSEVYPMRTSSRGCNVLVVEDHVESADVLARLLRMCGHQVKTAHTARDALDLAAKERFDVMVCDIGLPDGDGCRVFEEVKAMYGVRGIMLSGHDSPEILASAKKAGFSANLTKPVRFENIRSVLDQLCFSQPVEIE
jgi:CheY-like chemotaxis protein